MQKKKKCNTIGGAKKIAPPTKDIMKEELKFHKTITHHLKQYNRSMLENLKVHLQLSTYKKKKTKKYKQKKYNKITYNTNKQTKTFTYYTNNIHSTTIDTKRI